MPDRLPVDIKGRQCAQIDGWHSRCPLNQARIVPRARKAFCQGDIMPARNKRIAAWRIMVSGMGDALL